MHNIFYNYYDFANHIRVINVLIRIIINNRANFVI
ncbi:hypothetical protein C8C85_2139 [Flavobacterium sp. 103]|nr:hypothetical protein C8C85_2139 [Flavobacterium sp. 103]